MTDISLQQAYQHCQAIARQHYENFPVASLIVPKRLRQPITVIYAFARSADDFADEGDLDTTTRFAKLDDYSAKLEAIQNGQIPDDPIFIALAHVIAQHRLDPQHFHDLLTAFRMDVTKKRYADFGELMGYCRYSANPVGRLLLQLYGADSEKNIAWSDGICSALQLINFLQDIQQDYKENGRIYIPQDEMQRFHVTESHIRHRLSDGAMSMLMEMQIQRAYKLLKAGAPLGKALKGRIGFEMRLIIYGGASILRALQRQNNNWFSRPRLTGKDKVWMLWRALFPR